MVDIKCPIAGWQFCQFATWRDFLEWVGRCHRTGLGGIRMRFYIVARRLKPYSERQSAADTFEAPSEREALKLARRRWPWATAFTVPENIREGSHQGPAPTSSCGAIFYADTEGVPRPVFVLRVYANGKARLTNGERNFTVDRAHLGMLYRLEREL